MILNYLVIAGILSFIVAVLHLATILGGANWYRFFGAGEHMAQQAEINPITPALITFAISLIFLIWGGYAFSGAGIVKKLSLLKFGLILITDIYTMRGLGGIIDPFISKHAAIKKNSKTTRFAH